MTNETIEKTCAPQRSLKERQREERAELILQAAEAVLREKGYYDASMDEIAARVGVAKGTVYLHFPSKEDLVLALFDRIIRDFQQTIQHVTAQNVSAQAKLEHILRHTYEEIQGPRIQLFFALNSVLEVRKGMAEKQAFVRVHMDKVAADISRVLDEGKAAGEFNQSIPTTVLVRVFLGLLSPKSYEHLLTGAQMSPEALVSYVSQVFFHGITAA